MKRSCFFILMFVLIFITVNSFVNVGLLTLIEKLNIINYINDSGYECVYLNNSYEEVIDCLGVEVAKKIDVDNGFIVEAYVPVLNKYICSNYNKINIQISVRDDIVIVGYPLIKNSF